MGHSSGSGATGDANQASDPKRAGVGGAAVGSDQAAPAGRAEEDLTGGTERTELGADAGVTSGSRATATGANLGETEAAGDDRG
jgi:hypothetical protein